MGNTVRVKREILLQMLREARATPALECCGLLAGRDGVISAIFSAANALASPTVYDIAPRELFRIFREMRAAGLEHLGIYHSHPSGENVPSKLDLERAYYPGVAYFIVAPAPHVAHPIRAFAILEGVYRELEIIEE